MGEKEIKKEIEGIRKVTNNAIKSKESTLKLLVAAGIITHPKVPVKPYTKK